jgi:hypothetical protein
MRLSFQREQEARGQRPFGGADPIGDPIEVRREPLGDQVVAGLKQSARRGMANVLDGHSLGETRHKSWLVEGDPQDVAIEPVQVVDPNGNGRRGIVRIGRLRRGAVG